MSKIHPRRSAREFVLKALYAHSYLQENPKTILSRILDILPNQAEKNDNLYVEILYESVLKHCNTVDDIIKKNLQNWEFDRVAQLDKILLRMGVCELLFIEDVPPKTSISEMVEISKIYSTEESPNFINGILDAVYKNYKN